MGIVHTADAAGAYTVAGVVRPADFESAVFFTDAEAARLSPHVRSVAVLGPADGVRAVVGDRAEVLTGADRRRADPDVEADRRALINIRTLLGVAGGFTAFVVVFVVASTFAFGVAQRRQEFALLRTVGATPRQVRRMVLAEAAVIGAAASAAGCLLGAFAAPLLARSMVDSGLAPAWFHATFSLPALAGAFGVGLAVALLGAMAASARAGHVTPIEALRDAVVDPSVMTPGRCWLGLGLLFTAVAGMAWVAVSQPELATVPVIYLWVLMLPIAAVALLAPVAVPPVARLVTWPMTWLRGSAGLLVREYALSSARRTAATAAPVLLTVGLTLSLLGALAMIQRSTSSELAARVGADWVVAPGAAAGMNRSVVRRMGGVSGVDVAADVPTIVYTTDHGERLRDYDADAIDPAAFARVMHPAMAAGALTDLTDDTIVVSEGWDAGIGQVVPVWLADGTALSLRVVGVLEPTVDGPDAYVTARFAGDALVTRVYVKARPGADVATVAAALEAVTDGSGARVLPRDEWIAGADPDDGPAGGLGLIVALGVTLLYSAIAIVNTVVMAATGRIRETAVLRLAGATSAQVVRVAVAEAMLVAGLGVLLALAAFLMNFLGMRPR